MHAHGREIIPQAIDLAIASEVQGFCPSLLLHVRKQPVSKVNEPLIPGTRCIAGFHKGAQLGSAKPSG